MRIMRMAEWRSSMLNSAGSAKYASFGMLCILAVGMMIFLISCDRIPCQIGCRTSPDAPGAVPQFTCPNGTPLSGTPDGESDEVRCTECNDGYHLDGGTCLINTYTCAEGTPVAEGTPRRTWH